MKGSKRTTMKSIDTLEKQVGFKAERGLNVWDDQKQSSSHLGRVSGRKKDKDQ